jgi:hypothetical protein
MVLIENGGAVFSVRFSTAFQVVFWFQDIYNASITRMKKPFFEANVYRVREKLCPLQWKARKLHKKQHLAKKMAGNITID